MAFNYRNRNDESEENVRVKLPRGREVIGIISQRLGAGRMYVSCMDGKTRNCRVPGRLKRALWLREGDVVIVEPWEFDEEKADVLYKYSKSAIEKLKREGKLNTNVSEF
jgi:translation initiation factor 1A